MGNRSSNSRSSGGGGAASTSTRSPSHAPVPSSPAVTALKPPVPSPPPVARPPHPLDAYAMPTGLYSSKETWTSVREHIIARRLAPRVHGVDDGADGMKECPLCLMFYAEYALNATQCCHSDLCSECYLHSQEPSLTAECPFCKRPAFSVVYIGDPTPLLHVSVDSKASPHVRSVEAERARARSRASTADMDKAILASHGVVFASVGDRAAIKEEIEVQELDSRRCMAAEAAARRSTPNVRFVASSPASRPSSAAGVGSPPGSALYRAAGPPGAISTPLSIAGMSPSPSLSRANTTSSSVAARVSGSHVSLGPPMAGGASSSEEEDDDDGEYHSHSAARYSMTMRGGAGPARAAALGAPAPPAQPASAGTIISAALRAVSESFLGAGNRAIAAASTGPTPVDAAWRQQLMRGSVVAGSRAASSMAAAVVTGDDEHEDEESHADVAAGQGRGQLAASINHWALRAGADGMDADALEEFMLGQAIMMSLQEAAAEAAAAAPPAAEVSTARAAPASHAASARDVLLSDDGEEEEDSGDDADDEAVASRRVGAAAAAVMRDSSDDDDEEEEADAGHAAAAPPQRVDTDNDDEAMLQLAMQLSLADATASRASDE